MKKKITLLLMAIALTLTACSGGTTETEATDTTEATEEAQSSETEATEATTDSTESESSETESAEDEGEPIEGGYLNFAIQSDPAAMNPIDTIDSSTGPVVNRLFDPLISIIDGEVVYFLAESITPSEDNLTYRIKLRDGLKWHDGEDITADDVIFTVEATLDENQESYKRSSLIINDEPVQVEKVDELTVDLILPEVVAPIKYDIERIVPIPEHIFADVEGKIIESEANANPIGSGPFQFKEQRSGEYVILKRFDDYYGGPKENGPAYLDGIVFRVLADPQASLIALLNGEIDTLGIDTKDLETVQQSDVVDHYVYPSTQVFNMVYKFTNEDLQNVNVRKAIAYGVNREELLAGHYGGGEVKGEPAYSFISMWSPYHTDDLEKYEYDPEKAKEILAEEGYEEGDITLTIGYTPANDKQSTFATIMQQQLAEIGINVELKSMERGAFVEALVDSSSTEFDLAYNGFNLGEEPSKYAPLFLSDNPNNFMGYSNERVDELFAAGNVETDEDARYDIYEELQQIIADEVPIMALEYPTSISAINSRVKGLYNPERGQFFTDISNVWVADAEEQDLDDVSSGEAEETEDADATESEETEADQTETEAEASETESNESEGETSETEASETESEEFEESEDTDESEESESTEG